MTKHVLRIPKRYFDASLRVGVRLTSHVIPSTRRRSSQCQAPPRWPEG